MISAVIYRELKLYMKSKAFLLSLLIQPMIIVVFFMTSIGNVVGHIDFKGVSVPYPSFAIPGIVIMTIMFTSMMCAQSIFNERFSNMITLILSSPVKGSSYVLGKILGVSLITVLQGFIMLLIAVLIFGADIPPGAIPLAIGTILIASFMYSAIYISLMARIRTITLFSSLVNILSLLWMYSAPIFYPLEAIPKYLTPVTYVNPATYILMIFRSQMFLNETPLSLLFATLIVTALLVGYASRSLKKFILP